MSRSAAGASDTGTPLTAPQPTPRRPARRLVIALAAAAAVVPLAIAPADAQNGVADAPFTCSSEFYQVIAGQLKTFDAETGVYSDIGENHNNFNAMAYRTADDFLYAVQSKTVLRIDAEGDIEDIGSSGGAAGAYTGDFGDDGLLYASRGGKNWHAIDVDTMAVTRIEGMDTTESGPADVANVHGLLYGIGKRGDLFIFDPVAQTATKGPAVSGLPASAKAYGAAWATAGGNLYVGRNSGEIYQITGYSGSSPQATQVGTSPNTSSNDGGSCPIAATPPGLSDVDGPEPETEPQTDEAKEASESYNENYDEISETYSDPNEHSETQMPEEHAPVETTEETYEPTPESGVATGDACEANLREDRLPRVDVPELAAYAEETVLFSTEFGSPPLEHFKILNGDWVWENDTFAQAHDCGYDTTVALQDPMVDHYRWEARFSSIKEDNHGGLLLNQSSLDTRSGASLVDLAEGGNVIRWGHYDDRGYYQQMQTFPITRPVTGEEVTLAAEVRGTAVTLFYNGERLADVTAPYASGLVGLVVNATPVAFHEVTLTGLPQ